MDFKTDKNNFILNGKPFFMLSGEIHYFRLNSDTWEKHLSLLKKSGCNTTSTYICWDWHEYEEGKFDFTGETDPSRNLIKYINLCKKTGLNLIVKPGPYILAEYQAHGLPGWLLKKLKEAFAIDENNNIIAHDILTYMSDEFLYYTFLWFDKIMPIISNNQCTKGGPVILMQVCNEVGIFQWLSGRIDYNKPVLRLYKEFIKNKYKNINNLNKIYETKYKNFDEIKPPAGTIENKKDYAAYYDFHLFYRHYFELYFDKLIKKIRNFDIKLQLTHNIPGWIYGSASELPMLISTYSEIMRKRDDIVFGLDHIPEFVSFRNAHCDLAVNSIQEALKPNGPVWAAEFQSGTREYHVKNYPNDMEMFYFSSIAHGLKSFNFYMFSQGINPANKGFFGKTFYFQTVLDFNGQKLPLYKVIKKITKFINEEKDNLLLSEIDSEICVGFYKPHFYTELTTSQMLKEKRLFVEKLGLYIDPRFMREAIFFDGLLRGLQTLNISYKICDLQNTDINKLLKYKQLWVTTTEFMDKETQTLLVSYVKNGGHLVIYPAIPTLDNYLNKCTVLKNEFKLNIRVEASPNKINVLDIEDVYTYSHKKQLYDANPDEVISVTKHDDCCGIKRLTGKGWFIALGFSFGYSSDEHAEIYKRITSFDKIKKEFCISDPDIQFVLRKGKKYDYLFLLNYHNENKYFLVNNKKYFLKPFSCKVVKK